MVAGGRAVLTQEGVLCVEVVQMCWAGGVGTLGGEVLSHQGDIVVAVEGRVLCGMGPRDRSDGSRFSSHNPYFSISLFYLFVSTRMYIFRWSLICLTEAEGRIVSRLENETVYHCQPRMYSTHLMVVPIKRNECNDPDLKTMVSLVGEPIRRLPRSDSGTTDFRIYSCRHLGRVHLPSSSSQWQGT